MGIDIVFLENLCLLSDPHTGKNSARAGVTYRQAIFRGRQSRQSRDQNQAQQCRLGSFFHLIESPCLSFDANWQVASRKLAWLSTYFFAEPLSDYDSRLAGATYSNKSRRAYWYRLHENLNTCFDTVGEIDFTARARRLRSWLAPCQELKPGEQHRKTTTHFF